MKNKPLIIFDCDPGVDDALTLLLGNAFIDSPMLVITCYGCKGIRLTTRNAHRLLHLMGRDDVPVIQGSPRPLMWQHPIEKLKLPTFFGRNGMNNVRFPESKGVAVIVPHHDVFVEHVAVILRKSSSVDYYLTGPCTNLARICLRYPDLVKEKVNKLVIMGGALGAGNTGTKDAATGLGVAEFNFYLDPIAVDVVLRQNLSPKIVTWDQAKSFNLKKSKVGTLRSRHQSTTHLIKAMSNFFHLYGHDTVNDEERKSEPFVILSDPIVLLTEPDVHGVGRLIKRRIRIVTEGDHFGQSVEHADGYDVEYFEFTKPEAAMEILLEGIGAEVG